MIDIKKNKKRKVGKFKKKDLHVKHGVLRYSFDAFHAPEKYDHWFKYAYTKTSLEELQEFLDQRNLDINECTVKQIANFAKQIERDREQEKRDRKERRRERLREIRVGKEAKAFGRYLSRQFDLIKNDESYQGDYSIYAYYHNGDYQYIGKTKNLKNRSAAHKSSGREDSKTTTKFSKYIREHGYDNLELMVLCEGMSKEVADGLELDLIYDLYPKCNQQRDSKGNKTNREDVFRKEGYTMNRGVSKWVEEYEARIAASKTM